MKNIIYLGALSAMLGLEPDVIEKLFGEMYKGKEKLLDGNVRALHLGRSYAQESLPSIGLRVERRDCVGDLVFVEGNAAVALGAVYGGATVCAWYPITPSSSVAEAFEGWCRKLRHDPETGRAKYAIVQAEDELASIGMVIGAGWNGARAFTATSGPGISLMTEFLGLAYFAEIPATIVNVQRGGPSTGMPTRTQQADLLACAYAGHGDTKHVLLFPEDPPNASTYSAGTRPGGSAADADLRDDRSRHRHEPSPVRAAQVGRRAPAGHGQDHDRRGARGRRGLRPLPGCRR
jgi:2-oxoglutarate ferredoxin oxidoreductase subunit alpha